MIKILIVDDESIKERAIRSYINDSDVFVEVASSINAALEKIRNEQFDLAIIDMKIPENSSTIETNTNGGITLIERIKSLKSSKKPKNIICITSDKELLKEALKQAQPGWFDARNWHFWHYRLYGSDTIIPKLKKRKCIDNEAI